MAKYILTRLVKSVISLLIVVSIVVLIVFHLVPESRSFVQDSGFQRMKGNPKTVYYYSKLEALGYLDYVSMQDISKIAKSGNVDSVLKQSTETSMTSEGEIVTEEVEEAKEAKETDQAAMKKATDLLEQKGYTIVSLDAFDDLQGGVIAYRYYNSIELLSRFFSRLIVIDTPNFIQDPNNPNLERYIRFGTDHNGMPAIIGSGTLHKYLLYFDTNFPFVHQNFITLDFGESYPSNQGVSTLSVISTGQGPLKNIEQKFPKGDKLKSPINQHSLKYKTNPDALDKKRFEDNYADGDMYHENFSMVGTSYFFGILSLIVTYAVAIPMAVAMAKNQGKLVDHIGIGYINLLISVPSLAFIFFMKYVGFAFGLPDRFPFLGFNDPRSYIMPIIILGLLSTPSLIMWVRRYMVDQSTSDYVKFAKAKGLSSSEISRNHIFRNAIIPIINGIPSSVILAISGAVLTESVFSIPGMGKMLPDAIKVGNNNMVITLAFIFTALSIAAVFLGDILMTIVDPRITLQAKKGGE